MTWNIFLGEKKKTDKQNKGFNNYKGNITSLLYH